jgi:hypothetical protein
VSQTYWIIDDERMGEASVEVIYRPNIGYNHSKLASSGNNGWNPDSDCGILCRR